MSCVFKQALEILGPDRPLFGTDSSFLPRGWQRPVWQAMQAIDELGVDDGTRAKVLSGNFECLFAG